DIAFHLGIGSHEEPFHWIVSPLAGTGAIVLGIKSGDIDVYIEAGLGVGLEIAVAIASGGASIVLSLSVEVNGHSVDLGVTLTGRPTTAGAILLASSIVPSSPAPDPVVGFTALSAKVTAAGTSIGTIPAAAPRTHRIRKALPRSYLAAGGDGPDGDTTTTDDD